ncbi:glycosyltransferase [Brevibacillus fulvus]|uniref:MGT family glycosyltransferase n=1 Tax=Brevibacillus fulvus TaxID=1125967 RepID=A0A938XWY6_9BACL|nr:glycosyltransferase [Brevibacillus fulvus]MBM7589659.1 MGT family glycosyltransferase [Brevibacillus fulvus]
MARIALVSQIMLGHMIPALDLGAELARRGHQVSVLAPRQHQGLIEEAGLIFVEIGLYTIPHKYIGELFAEVDEFIKRTSIDLLICDSALAAPAYAAELHGIPWVSFQTTVPLPDHLVPGGERLNSRLRELYEKQLNTVRLQHGLPALTDKKRTRGDFAGLSGQLHLLMVIPEMIPDWANLPEPSRIVGICSYDGDEESNWIDLDSEDPVILVCSSSVQRAEFVQMIQHYLHTAVEAFSHKPYKLVVTHHEPYQGEEPLPDNVLWVTDYPVHSRLMPQADIVITHGGCGTLQKSLKYGVPMVIIPLGADHPFLAEHCESLGVAKVLTPEQVTVATMEATVKSILGDSSYRRNAQRIASYIYDHAPCKTSADYVEALLGETKIVV